MIGLLNCHPPSKSCSNAPFLHPPPPPIHTPFQKPQLPALEWIKHLLRMYKECMNKKFVHCSPNGFTCFAKRLVYSRSLLLTITCKYKQEVRKPHCTKLWIKLKNKDVYLLHHNNNYREQIHVCHPTYNNIMFQCHGERLWNAKGWNVGTLKISHSAYHLVSHSFTGLCLPARTHHEFLVNKTKSNQGMNRKNETFSGQK